MAKKKLPHGEYASENLHIKITPSLKAELNSLGLKLTKEGSSLSQWLRSLIQRELGYEPHITKRGVKPQPPEN